MESHNDPSYIEPYQGATTGVGGILRDVFTMGARPIACLNALSFGAPGHPETPASGGRRGCRRRRLRQLVRRATVGGRVRFHTGYDGNLLVQRDDGRPRRRATKSSCPPPRAANIPTGLCRRQAPTATASAAPPWRRVRSSATRLGPEAPHGSGRRPVRGKAADGGLPGNEGTSGRRRRHPGHGGGRA